jgi:hypothetical protein
MSASGQYQTAVVYGNGASNGIYYSANYGLSWTQASGAPTSVELYSVCCTASGQYQVAVMNNASNTGVYYSMNYGVNWLVATTAMGLPSGTPRWTFSEISDNGQYCTIVAQTGQVFQTVLRQPSLYTSGGAIIAGNVGIGTMNTSTILQVSNSAITTSYTSRVTMGVSDGLADPDTSYGMLNLTRPNNVTDHKGHIAFIRNGNTIQSLGYLQGSNTFGWVASGNMNTTSGIFMMSTGNVGIRTTSPAYTLAINGIIGLVNTGLTNTNQIQFNNNTNTYTIQQVDNAGANYLRLGRNGFGDIVINSSGNVGIGITNPPHILTPFSNITLPTLTLAAIWPCQLSVAGNPAAELLLKIGSYYTASVGSYCAIQSTETYSGVEHVQPLVLQPIGGNVGIGITNPIGLLHVKLDGTGGRNPTSWSSGYALFGPASTPSAPAVGLTWNTALDYGILLSVSPSLAWKEMFYMAGGTHSFFISNILAGYVNSTGFINSSDEREKINIKNINTSRSLERILACRPTTFQRVMDRNDPMIPESDKNKWHIGLIAQEVLSVNPHCISECTNQAGEQRYGINYSDFITHLIGSIQEHNKTIQEQTTQISLQQSKIESLESRLASLEQRLINAGIA